MLYLEVFGPIWDTSQVLCGSTITWFHNKLIPIGGDADAEDLAMQLGYKVRGIPYTYLGLPMGAPFRLVAEWDLVEERFCRWLLM